MNMLAKFVLARMREPSTYAGLGAILVDFHVSNAASWAHDFTTMAIGLAGLLAMFVKETGALD